MPTDAARHDASIAVTIRLSMLKCYPLPSGRQRVLKSPLQARHEFRQSLDRTHFTAIDVAGGIHRDAFAHRSVSAHAGWILRHVLGHEVPHLAGARAADAQSLAPARVVVVVGLRVDRI